MVDQTGMTGPLEIVSVEADPSFLKTSLEPVGELAGTTQKYHLIIELPRVSRESNIRWKKPASLHIKTNHPMATESISIFCFHQTNHRLLTTQATHN